MIVIKSDCYSNSTPLERRRTDVPPDKDTVAMACRPAESKGTPCTLIRLVARRLILRTRDAGMSSTGTIPRCAVQVDQAPSKLTITDIADRGTGLSFNTLGLHIILLQLERHPESYRTSLDRKSVV